MTTLAATTQRMGVDPSDRHLRECRSFRVECEHRLVGFVEEPLYGVARTLPAALLVRSGLFGRRVLIIPVEVVAQIDGCRRSIVLGPTWRAAAVPLEEGSDTPRRFPDGQRQRDAPEERLVPRAGAAG